jgi:DNA-binding MarR family transcriptional regulator
MTQRENQQFIFGSIFLLANKLQLLGDRVTQELTLKQWFLLIIMRQMDNKFPNYNDIAKAVGTSRQNISKMIAVLHKKGMVDLHPSNTDQRAIYVTLTEKCFDYFSSKENAGNMLLDMLFSSTSPAETEQTAVMLGKLLQNAEIYSDGEENF